MTDRIDDKKERTSARHASPGARRRCSGGARRRRPSLQSISRRAVTRAASATSGDRPFEILFAIYPNGTLLDFAGTERSIHENTEHEDPLASSRRRGGDFEHGVVFGKTEQLRRHLDHRSHLCAGRPDLTSMMKPDMLGHTVDSQTTRKYATSVRTGLAHSRRVGGAQRQTQRGATGRASIC